MRSTSSTPASAPGEEVELRSIDSLAEKYCGSGDRIALIKVDVDGAEPTFLDGASRTISSHRPIIFMEFAPANLRDAETDPGEFLRSLVADFNVLRVRYDTLTVTQVAPGDIDQVVAETTGRIADLVLSTRPIELDLPKHPGKSWRGQDVPVALDPALDHRPRRVQLLVAGAPSSCESFGKGRVGQHGCER